MRFKTKQKGPLRADEMHQAEQMLFRFVQNESFPNVSKSITISKEISKTLHLVKLSPSIGRLKHSNLDYNAKHPILLTAKHPVVQLLLEKAHRDNLHDVTECEKHASTKVLDHRIEKCIKENEVRMYQMQTQKRQPNSSTDG